MSLQERTLVVKNFDPDRTTHALLQELFIQAGPVRAVVLKPDHAFVEYEDVESVGYAKALLDGVRMFGKSLILEPKLRQERYQKYTRSLNEYIDYDKREQESRAQERLSQDNHIGGQSTPMLTIPPLPQILSNMPFNPLPQYPSIQLFEHQPFIQPMPVMQQQPFYQFQVQPQSLGPSNYRPPPVFQAPPDVMRQQMIQTSPYIVDPLQPPPEGRGYQPWLHEQPIQRANSFNHLRHNNFAFQHQRRLSDRPPDFAKRRR